MAVIGAFEWAFENPEVGWVIVVFYLIWEIRGPRGRINELIKSINSLRVVVRALVRANDNVDTNSADELLADNGHEPHDFIDDREEAEQEMLNER